MFPGSLAVDGGDKNDESSVTTEPEFELLFFVSLMNERTNMFANYGIWIHDEISEHNEQKRKE